MSDKNPEMRANAARICRDYLTGVWKQVNAENIVVNHIRFVDDCKMNFCRKKK